MGSNVLPFAVRRAAPEPTRSAAVRLIVVTKKIQLALSIAPHRRA